MEKKLVIVYKQRCELLKKGHRQIRCITGADPSRKGSHSHFCLSVGSTSPKAEITKYQICF